jgi:hypothetical protein
MTIQRFFKLLHQPPMTFSKRRQRAIYTLSAVAVILLGGGLVWVMITTQGLLLPADSVPRGPSDQLPASFSPSVLYWEEQVLAWSEQFDLDPLLVATVMQIESCGNPVVASPVGAQGLFQVMPFHFTAGEDMLDPQTNAARGLAYLKLGYDLADGDIGKTLAGYNGGHGQIDRSPLLWPDETQDYVHWGLGIYQDAANSAYPSPTLAAWLNAGGASLCKSAEEHLALN